MNSLQTVRLLFWLCSLSWSSTAAEARPWGTEVTGASQHSSRLAWASKRGWRGISFAFVSTRNAVGRSPLLRSEALETHTQGSMRRGQDPQFASTGEGDFLFGARGSRFLAWSGLFDGKQQIRQPLFSLPSLKARSRASTGSTSDVVSVWNRQDFLDSTRRQMENCVSSCLSQFLSIGIMELSVSVLGGVGVEMPSKTGKKVSALSELCSIRPLGGGAFAVSVHEAKSVSAVLESLQTHAAGLRVEAFREADDSAGDNTMFRVERRPITREWREAETRRAKDVAEAAKTALRNVRRETLDKVRSYAKAGRFGKDEERAVEKAVDRDMAEFTSRISSALAKKETSILQN